MEFDFGASYMTFAGHGITMSVDCITGGTVAGNDRLFGYSGVAGFSIGDLLL